jgi:hypothetical protein
MSRALLAARLPAPPHPCQPDEGFGYRARMRRRPIVRTVASRSDRRGASGWPSDGKREGRALCVFAIAAVAALLHAAPRAAAGQKPPRPVRNDVARDGRELLVLRHQKLLPGSHQRFLELSRDGMWPFWEKIGVRIVGQWRVVHPEGGGDPAYEEGYRLARYRSFDHWLATRDPERLGGDGPDAQASAAASAARQRLLLGSDGAIYLEGDMGPGGPYYLPGLDESYELVSSAAPGVAAGEAPGVAAGSAGAARSSPLPVRNDLPRPGTEIVTLRSFRIAKSSFEEFHRLSREDVWPYFEKTGARVIGQWKRVYPQLEEAARSGSSELRRESPDYDEAYMMVRYASYEHWQATRPQVMARLGGDGPDYQACVEGLRRRAALTLASEVRFLEGYLHHSSPLFLPAVDEDYRPVGEPSDQ